MEFPDQFSQNQLSQERDIVKNYYTKKGLDRNSSQNSGLTYQALSKDLLWRNMFLDIDRNSSILDIGGGLGDGLLRLISLGFEPQKLALVDILPERIEQAQRLLPQSCILKCQDAQNLSEFYDSYEVVICASTFLTITDDDLASRIALEMIKCTKPKGYILIFDWRYSGNKGFYKKVDRKRISRLFVHSSFTADITLQRVFKGSLIPPLGRFLSEYFPAAYFPVRQLPFLTGYMGYKLYRK
jgi:ubiquinone/menaquinone biosynthesis C-methylase UbiE